MILDVSISQEAHTDSMLTLAEPGLGLPRPEQKKTGRGHSMVYRGLDSHQVMALYSHLVTASVYLGKKRGFPCRNAAGRILRMVRSHTR